MKIIVDAFGGDHAPLEVLKGCERAVKELGVEIILTGNQNIIKKCAEENNISLEKTEIVHTEEVFDIHEEPSKIMKTGKNTSLAVGLQQLRDGKGDAFLSAGSTGALVVGATMIAKRIKGIKRVALAPVMPSAKGYFMLLDAGANTECRPEMLSQFGAMGSAYMSNVMGIKNPKVALANIGAEEKKGNALVKETYPLLKAQGNIHFVGNIEARDIPNGDVDVVVADGYTGNMLLKLYEGRGRFFANKVKEVFSGFIGVLSGLLILKRIKLFRKQMDYKEIGGAVLLGVSKPVIKAHGSSDANAFFNAIRQAKKCVDGDVVGKITDYISADIKE